MSVQGMVSMAANGASSVKGGNRQIFQQFAKRSGAKIHLNTIVKSIRKLESSPHSADRSWLVRYEDTRSGSSAMQAYDAIIYAAPMHPPGPSALPPVDFIGTNIPSTVPAIPYVNLHVTIVVTNASNPRPEFFFGEKGAKPVVPKTILATFQPFEDGISKIRPRINSLNYLRNIGDLDEEVGDGTGTGHVVKRTPSVRTHTIIKR